MGPTHRDLYVAPWRRLDWACVALILGWGVAWLSPNLGHPSIHNWDEALHQVVTRGVYDSFFYPHMYADPLYPTHPEQWWYADVWLLKPAGPFWFGAALMHLIGVTPLALRIGSLLGELGAAVALCLMVRGVAGRLWATIGALGFLALPFGWILTQGHMFGDATDCTLVGWVTVSMAMLLWSVEKQSWRWAAAAGAAAGAAYLCKTLLALAPLGVAGVMWLLGVVRFCAGPRLKSVAAMFGAAVLVAAPWNLYAAWKWPAVYFAGSKLAFGHILQGSGADVGPWARPFDAIFNEVNATELRPIPVAVGVLVLGWLLYRALRRREFVVVGLALWLGSTWVMHSIVSVKAPAHVWNAVPAVFAGLAIIGVDVWRSGPLGAAAVAAFASGWAIGAVPGLGRVREWLPSSFDQTRRLPGLAEGAVLIAAAVVVGLLLGLRRRGRAVVVPVLAAGASVLVGWTLLVKGPSELRRAEGEKRPTRYASHTRELGLALGELTPPRSVLWQEIDVDPKDQFEVQNLMFWSGRMSYRRGPDLAAAQAKGYESYLISPVARPYAPVEGVPAHAWLRAYDLGRPGEPPPIPAGATPLDVQLEGASVLGFASGRIDGERDRYAFFVRPRGVPAELRIVFHTRAGSEEQLVAPEACLRGRASLADVPWFILPVVGPPRGELEALELGGVRVGVGRFRPP
ncbi:MAG: glycosyltransferase family 39 protein [Myxococcales bacterium]|nr:glycosyltransferase family 39 protein [Myxococcales bacterium]